MNKIFTFKEKCGNSTSCLMMDGGMCVISFRYCDASGLDGKNPNYYFYMSKKENATEIAWVTSNLIINPEDILLSPTFIGVDPNKKNKKPQSLLLKNIGMTLTNKALY